jgi:hypothetical protein
MDDAAYDGLDTAFHVVDSLPLVAIKMLHKQDSLDSIY